LYRNSLPKSQIEDETDTEKFNEKEEAIESTSLLS
jgi:hypothetical protein